MRTKIHVAFLWHMHQPWYILPEGAGVLPWARLRASKDYYDMAQHLITTDFTCNVNFTPVLTEQIRLLSEGKVSDPYTPDGPPSALEELKSGLIPMPISRRGFSPPAEFSSSDEFWAWFFLSWTAQTAIEEEAELQKLLATEKLNLHALETLQAWHKKLIAAVLPLYRRLSESGQIELSTTPFYHPILPLLLESSVAKRAQPHDEIPVFRAPEDAQVQAERALHHHQEIFGQKPEGMWPAEGAVSPEALELLAKLGVRWVVTDGAILAKTLGRPPSFAELYRPWRLRLGSHEIFVFFRDTLLSNLLSFEYGKWPWEKAIEDFLSRVHGNCSGWKEKAPPLVVIAMDGENAWDYYERNGRPFLLGLYRAIQEHFQPITLSAYLSRYGWGGELSTIWSGSWIDADFRTWIGEPLQNRAWIALAEARDAAQSSSDPQGKAKAFEHLYICEGSDWFWWRSSKNHTPLFSHFARLFRAHLAQAWRELGKAPPAYLETL